MQHSRVVTTDISTVTIEGDTVYKRYVVGARDKVSGHCFAEIAILRLLNGARGFPHMREARVFPFEPSSGPSERRANCVIVMDNAGLPLRRPRDPLRAMVELLKLVATLHHNYIVHCDLKPNNILVRNDPESHESEYSIIDFSHSYIVRGTSRTLADPSAGGARIYSAPEMLANDSLALEIRGWAVDIWSLGCVFYEMLEGKFLFWRREENARDDEESVTGAREAQADIATTREMLGAIADPQYRAIITAMLAQNPARRPSSRAILRDYFSIDYVPPIIFDCALLGNITHLALPPDLSWRMHAYNLPHVMQYAAHRFIDAVVLESCGEHDAITIYATVFVMLQVTYKDRWFARMPCCATVLREAKCLQCLADITQRAEFREIFAKPREIVLELE